MGRLLAEEERLALVSKQHKSYQENKEKVAKKIGKYREKIGELQTAIESRVDQFSQQESLLS